MRDGPPLPALTPQQLVSQLTHRVFGPLHPGKTRVVLDYHGLLEHPAGTLTDIAARHQVTSRTVTNRVVTIRARGVRQPISETITTETTRPSRPDEDHLGRVRIAATLGLPEPVPAPVPAPVQDAVPPATYLSAARAALRVLAATGPLTRPTLIAAITRSHRFRDRENLSSQEFAAAMAEVGGTLNPDGTWNAPTGITAPDRYQTIITQAADRELTRKEMIDILIDAGYSHSSANGRMSSSHPLFHRVGPNRYRLISNQEPQPETTSPDPASPDPASPELEPPEIG